MPAGDAAGMDTPIALRERPPAAGWSSRGLRLFGIALCAVSASCLLWSWQPAARKVTSGTSANQLVHWRDADHDWLLVVDPATRELVVYDAVDGRPLDRLGADDGLPDVQSIAPQGRGLLVAGAQPRTARRLELPELRAVAIDGR